MHFSNRLIFWYKSNKRDLPWRRTLNPYYIWLSEIILQQTRVVSGTPYYLNFIKTFPRIEDLASADEDKILKMWQGLGYYSRARNLHYTAKYIVANFNSKFPDTYENILNLKGVGTYTAAAIASFAFSLQYAVVDGNVIRVLSRVFAIDTPFDSSIGKNLFQNLAQKLLLSNSPAIYNQAIMEFGALQCVPKTPNCFNCSINDICQAFSLNIVSKLPVKSKKINVKKRFLHFLMINIDEGFYLKKNAAGIWTGLYEFPFIEFSSRVCIDDVKNSKLWIEFFNGSVIDIRGVSEEFVHLLSHQKIYAYFWRVESSNLYLDDYQLISKKNLLNYPVSRLTEKFFESIDLA